MSQEFTLREVDITRDAEKLAVMWNESDDQWPGTWTGGVPMTAETIKEWYERENDIAIYVFETDDRIVGYCSFNERAEEKNVGYVGLLNVHPAYQGKSLGRRLLQRCLEHCDELGFHLLTLGTWPGNLKSVPLYKKTGFFWVPDTSVWMLNFVPSILHLPCARPFFERHDWYRTFKRELRQIEDDERWEGMKVFTYHWEEDGEALTVWADREAHTLTGVETGSFLAAAIADNIEPPKGLPTRLRWRLENKQDRPMSVSLIASGTEHIRLDHRASLTLSPGETVELEAAVDLAPDTPDARPHRPVPALRTIFILDGQVLELGTGVRPQPAVAVETAPRHVTLFPCVSKTIHLQLRSHLDREIEATISLAPTPGLSTDWTERQVQIPAKSFAAVPVELTSAAEGGVYPLLATVYFEGGRTQPERLAVLSLPAGGVLADQGPKETRIENEWLRVILRARGGETTFVSCQHGARLGGFSERIGPPFWPSELSDKEYTIFLQPEGGRIKAVLTADLEAHPGLTLHREIAMGGGPLVELSHTLANNGTEALDLQVSRHVWNAQRDQTTITLPLKGGIVQSRTTEFPDAEEDISKKPEAFTERWVALNSTPGTLGVLWEDTIVENEIAGWGSTFLTPFLNCPPQQWTAAGKFYVYTGPGDWRTVRQHARRLAGADGIPEPVPAEARRVYDARLEPAPLVTVDDRVTATLVVDNLRARPLEGQATLSLPEGLAVDQAAFEINGAARDEALRQKVTLTLDPLARAYEGSLSLQTRQFDVQIPVPVLRLGDRHKVTVTQEEAQGQPVYVIANGRTRVTVAPGFSGALIGWQENGVNHLLSPFPERKTFSWMSPWYGGITPLAFEDSRDDFPGKLDQESLAADLLEQPDKRGITWRGVRLACDLARENLVGLQLELDYLTLGHSNVLKLACRVRNTTTAKRRIGVGWISFWQPDGSSAANVLRSQDIERKHTPWFGWPEANHWGAVVNPETGRTAVLSSPYPNAKLMDWGDAGGHVGWFSGIDVMPLSTTERTCYVALCDTFAQARTLTWLKQYI